RLLVATPGRLEHAVPHILGVCQHAPHEPGHLVVLLTDARLLAMRNVDARVRARARHLRHPRDAVAASARKKLERIDSEHQADRADDEQGGDAEPAAADRNAQAAPAPTRKGKHAPATLAAPILDVLAFPI